MHNILLQNARQKMRRIEQLLRRESQRTIRTGMAAIKERSAAEDAIQLLLYELSSLASEREDVCSHIAPRLEELAEEFLDLPFVPRIEGVTWAQSLCQLKPRILVINDGVDEQRQKPFIHEIAVIDWTQKPIFHQQFFAGQPSLAAWSSPTELLTHTATEGPSIPIAQVWSNLLQAVSGHAIVTYSISLAQIQLTATARLLHQKVPMLVGQSILDIGFAYLGYEKEEVLAGLEEDPATLPFSSALSTQLGDPLSEANSYDALHRARCIHKVLQDIAQGTLNVES